MPALNFNKRFADAVRSGRKRQTIRRSRQRPIEVGQPLQLYTGMRTKHCQKLGISKCIAVHAIEIYILCCPYEKAVSIDGRKLEAHELEPLAQADGFQNFNDFFGWFFDYDPDKEIDGFVGQLIKWEQFAVPDSNSGIEL